MKNFIKVIKEINRTLNFLIIFETTINAVIFFLVVYLLLSLINLYPILALIPAIVYFISRLYVNSKTDKRRIVESKHEPLKEKLRTAADNYQAENPVVNELQDEVVQELKHVGLSSFISTKRISRKILTTILLSFAIVFATTLNLYIVDLNQFLVDLPEYIGNINPLKIADNTQLGEINESEDIYGDSKLAILGNQKIDIRIKPVNYEVNVREEGDVEQKQFDEIFPNDVNVEQSSAFEEDIPEEQQQLVKNYFNKLAGG
ncbi:hypothetical protein CMO93_02390 [Candidatus Woesearchaeota archaeon]|nr:hypothetical protein [Candidatus Woesearchaeota archaeon]|tara:strand:+ start:129 stop:908 length:780 start_codon:yes stop_codon:yes gene_type:complete